jgi:hypothetical protein
MKKETKNFLLICPLTLLTLIIPSFLWSNQILSSVLLILVGLLMLSIDWRYKNLVFYLVVLISAPMAEAIAIYFGAWTYTRPVFIGIPIWLFFVWGNAGLYVVKLKEFIFSLKK